jgi:hypothetical protein
MKSVVAQMLLVVLLVVAGMVLWTVGAAEARLAAAQQMLVTLRYDLAAEELQTGVATNAVGRLVADTTGISSTRPTRSAQPPTGSEASTSCCRPTTIRRPSCLRPTRPIARSEPKAAPGSQ